MLPHISAPTILPIAMPAPLAVLLATIGLEPPLAQGARPPFYLQLPTFIALVAIAIIDAQRLMACSTPQQPPLHISPASSLSPEEAIPVFWVLADAASMEEPISIPNIAAREAADVRSV